MKQPREQRFSNIVKRLMARKGLSVDDVAHRIGCSKPTVQRWIDGRNQPHPAMWKWVIKDLRE